MDALDADPDAVPDPALLTFADELLSRWPDVPDDEDDDEETPWADAPLKNNVVGDVFYFSMVHSQAVAAMPFIVECATNHGLVCFDPQAEQLMTPPGKRRGFFRRD